MLTRIYPSLSEVPTQKKKIQEPFIKSVSNFAKISEHWHELETRYGKIIRILAWCIRNRNHILIHDQNLVITVPVEAS